MFRFSSIARSLVLSVIVGTWLPGALAAQTISGAAHIVDGDTLRLGQFRIRLAGIDAPETAQTCGDTPCGQIATATLASLIASDTVTCELTGDATYDRWAGTCATARIADLGREMVRAGHAWDEPRYLPNYETDQRHAEGDMLGIWAYPVQVAWEWRATDRSPAPDADCRIKGNISASGRIYHRPGTRSYAATRISEGHGERWFCSTAQAEAAGWRAPR